MAKKPPILCRLLKGKFIGNQPYFVDTFNWMVDFCANLKGKDGIKVDTSVSDRPVIKLDKGKEEVEVVTHVEYDEATHTFTQYKRKLAGPIKFADEEATPSTVFVATPIET